MNRQHLRWVGGLLLAGLALAGTRRATAATFTVTNTSDSGSGSLRQAILDANGAAGADTVQFGSGVSGTITLSSGQLSVTGDLTLGGPGAGNLTVSGNNANRAFQIASGATVRIAALTVTQGRADTGGAILNQGGILTLENVTVSNSRAIGSANGGVGRGGGVANLGGTLTVKTSTITGNQAIGGDGGTSSLGDVLNPAALIGQGVGGGIASVGVELGLAAATTTIENTSVDGNQVHGGSGGSGGSPGLAFGGGIDSGVGCALTVSNTTITRNLAIGGNGTTGGAGMTVFAGASAGGGIHTAGSGFLINVTLSRNESNGGNGNTGGNSFVSVAGEGLGGGIENEGILVISDSTIELNLVRGGNNNRVNGGINGIVVAGVASGGGVSFSPAVPGAGTDGLIISNTTISRNQALGGSGGVGGTGFFVGIGAAVGGGIQIGGGSLTQVNGSRLAGNQARAGNSNTAAQPGLLGSGVGGAIGAAFFAALAVNNTTIADNEASGGLGPPGSPGGFGLGGGLFLINAFVRVDIANSTLTNNLAVGVAGGGALGGGLYNEATTTSLVGTQVTGNRALGLALSRRPQILRVLLGPGQGGGVAVKPPGGVCVGGGTVITGNHASNGADDVLGPITNCP